MTSKVSRRVPIDSPRWDQSTFIGRLKHFAAITDPRTVLVREKELDEAKELLNLYRLGKEPPGTTEKQLWRAKVLYDSAFHPDTGQKQNVIGRMSFQVPGGMAITGCMLQFYRTTPAVIFWQWVNQSFNALVNYTNRNAQSDFTIRGIIIAYASATTSALVTAVGLKTYLEKRASSLMQRFVPFAAVAAANCVNIPLMRQSELRGGIAVRDENDNTVGRSRLAAAKGIIQVIISRITMAAPGMLILPLIMERLEKEHWMQKITPLHGPIQVVLVGFFLIVMVPTACALFPQRCSLRVETLKRWEPSTYKSIRQNEKELDVSISHVYFNKGL